MFKKFNVVFLIMLAFGIGYSVNNIAMSSSNLKVAVVDTTRIISNSQEVKNLKAEQQAKIKEMQKTLETAQAEIAKNKILQKPQNYKKNIERK